MTWKRAGSGVTGRGAFKSLKTNTPSNSATRLFAGIDDHKRSGFVHLVEAEGATVRKVLSPLRHPLPRGHGPASGSSGQKGSGRAMRQSGSSGKGRRTPPPLAMASCAIAIGTGPNSKGIRT